MSFDWHLTGESMRIAQFGLLSANCRHDDWPSLGIEFQAGAVEQSPARSNLPNKSAPAEQDLIMKLEKAGYTEIAR